MSRAVLHPLRRVVTNFPVAQVQRKFSVFDGVLKVLTPYLPKRPDIGSARSLLYNCKDQADNNLWYTRGLVGTDFRSRQILLMLHVWLIHKRLIMEGKEGQRLQEALFDQLWEDTSNRIRSKGIGEMSLNKHLKGVQAYSFRVCLELDHVVSLLNKPNVDIPLIKTLYDYDLPATSAGANGALTVPQVESFVKEAMGSVLWEHVYLEKKKDGLTEDHIRELTGYMWSEHQSMMQVSREAILDARVEFGPVPTWGKAEVQAAPDARKRRSERQERPKGEWREATAADGKSYYWNTVTRETRWDKPKELANSEA